LPTAPGPEIRDWIGAVRRAGTELTWQGSRLAPTAIAVEPVADPTRPSQVWVAAPARATVVVRVELGVIDSVAVRRAGGALTVPRVEGVVRAEHAGTAASAARRDSLVLHPVLVLALASWEGKFVAAALEERGWEVDTRFAIAPVSDAAAAGPVRIDTSRYAAVIALDSTAMRYAPQIVRYVRAGGGFIAAGEATSYSAIVSLLPARTEQPTHPGPFESGAADPRGGLALIPLIELKPGALVLERSGDDVAVAGWRVGAGRALQVGYVDTWRWRMGGAETDPVAAHRVWWSALVSAVAYAPRLELAAGAVVEQTPLASLVTALGASSAPPSSVTSWLDAGWVLPVCFGLVMLLLLGEWASRRLRVVG
jgi:hypothetical protein